MDTSDALLSAPMHNIYFDKSLNAWVLSRHTDVLAAFRCPFLHPAGPRSKLKTDKLAANNNQRSAMRTETTNALSPAVLHSWQSQMRDIAQKILTNFSTSQPVDLIDEYAKPVSHWLAIVATGGSLPLKKAESLLMLAEAVSTAAAEPFDESLAARAKAADEELRKHFHSGPAPLRESGFVALSQTLPRMLANAWVALIQQPSEWRRLHSEPTLISCAVEELLRYGGLPRILFRIAGKSIDFNGASIQEGDRLILSLAVANRDPAHCQSPDLLDITRRPIHHFSLGNGRHSCVGAPLIRMVLATLTDLLVKRYGKATLYQEIKWRGGSGFRFPNALYVLLHS